MKLTVTAKNLLMALALCCCAGGCSDEDERVDSIYIYNADVAVGSEAGLQTVTVSASCDWTAEVSDAWLAVTPGEGRTGISVVTVTYESNLGEVSRKGQVVFTAGEYTDVLTVTQASNQKSLHTNG